MKKITRLQIKKATDALKIAAQNASRKLFELEVLQSQWEIQNGKGTIYDSVDDLMEHINKKLRETKK